MFDATRDEKHEHVGVTVRQSPLRLYAPFLAIVLVQALVIAVAPSTAPSAPGIDDPLAADAADASPPDGTPSFLPEEDAPDDDGFAVAGDFPSDDDSTSGSHPDAAGQDAAAPRGTDGDRGSVEVHASGDTSHCTDNGRQHGLIYHAPPCVPRWPSDADNGGATYRGVTADEVTVVVFRENRNEQVTTLLAAEGLRATEAQEVAFMEAAEAFLNDHYEFYGRTVNLVRHRAMNCPETPPDVPACRQAAREMIRELDPFAVIWDVPTYPEVFDEFTRAGVISIGGWHFDNRFVAGRRPYRWDVFMDGTATATFVGEYYCKKLANENATHSGEVIHPQIGARGQVPRRLGIVAPDTDAQFGPARHLASIVESCDQNPPFLIGYDQDIETGARQANAITQALIDAGVTTVVMIADPIAPIFRTNNQTRNGYFPEILMAGSGLLDYDKLGRLYDQQQMRHAFGPSHLAEPYPHSRSNATVMWRAAGNSGDACQSCNLPASYFSLLGTMIQSAGPNLNPLTVERGMHALPDRGGWAESGGDARQELFRFGQGNYTGLNDIREVYWSRSASSPIDGRPGAYVAMNDGRRYAPGELTSTFDVPVAPQ